MHRWSNRSQLGDHDHREATGTNEQEVVLAIRGELLKKYPTAVIYAHRAEWIRTATGTIDLTKPRKLASEQPQEGSIWSSTIINMPLYEAKVEPDIYFFGFKMTVCAAKGGSGKLDEPANAACAQAGIPWDDPGWFFVIRERPGEPRFGLDAGDATFPSRVEVWNDLSWNQLTPTVPEGGFIQVTENFPGLDSPPIGSDRRNQHDDDVAVSWNQTMSSADLAYILYQVPVLVAVHASDMLPD